jgi:hypothetical protein
MPGPIRRLFPSAADQRRAAEKKEREEQEAADKKKLDADTARRALVRKARGMVLKLDEQIVNLDHKRRESHDAARRSLASGDSASAQRHVLAVRQKLLLIEKVEKKRFVFEHAAVMTEMSVSEREMTELMADMARVNHVDPARIEQAMQGVMEAIERGHENEGIWDDMSRAQIRDLGLSSSAVPSVDKLLQDLSNEVAQGIRTGSDLAGAAPTDGAVKQRIGEGRALLTRLVDDLK